MIRSYVRMYTKEDRRRKNPAKKKFAPLVLVLPPALGAARSRVARSTHVWPQQQVRSSWVRSGLMQQNKPEPEKNQPKWAVFLPPHSLTIFLSTHTRAHAHTQSQIHITTTNTTTIKKRDSLIVVLFSSRATDHSFWFCLGLFWCAPSCILHTIKI